MIQRAVSLRTVKDQDLLRSMDEITGSEAELLTLALRHLREIERRRLFSSEGFQSMWDYCTRKLKYSSDQTHRRLSAARLLEAEPQLEAKIESGELSLTNLSIAQSLFRQEAKSGKPIPRQERLGLLEKLENKSTREAQKIVLQVAPKAVAPERVRQVAEELVEYRFTASPKLQQKIEKLRGLKAHTASNLVELLEQICDLALDKLDPVKKTERAEKRAGEKLAEGAKPLWAPKVALSTELKAKQRYVPSTLRQLVWRRAQNMCENCRSTHALQIEHVLPWASGGPTKAENLKLLCRHCNQRNAIVAYGQSKMDTYMNQPM